MDDRIERIKRQVIADPDNVALRFYLEQLLERIGGDEAHKVPCAVCADTGRVGYLEFCLWCAAGVERMARRLNMAPEHVTKTINTVCLACHWSGYVVSGGLSINQNKLPKVGAPCIDCQKGKQVGSKKVQQRIKERKERQDAITKARQESVKALRS